MNRDNKNLVHMKTLVCQTRCCADSYLKMPCMGGIEAPRNHHCEHFGGVSESFGGHFVFGGDGTNYRE